jgi:hypothetical protein
MTSEEAWELMNGEAVRMGDTVGEVVMPSRPTGWFRVAWETGAETVHEIAAPHSVAKLERVKPEE